MKTCWFTWRSSADGSVQKCALEWGHQDPTHENENEVPAQELAPWGPWGKGWPDQDPDL